MAGSGAPAGLLHDPDAREDIPIILRLPREDRGSLEPVRAIRLGATSVSIGELTHTTRVNEAQTVYHKNLLPVTYVTGDVAGSIESPVYAILQMNHTLSAVRQLEVRDEVGRRVAHHL
jgi:multidrug efflux pump subunit AcrB